VYFLWFDIPIVHENTVRKKRKREETNCKQNFSKKYIFFTTTLPAKQSLEEVLLDNNQAYMHKLIHLQSWQFFMLAERLCPLIEWPRDGKAVLLPEMAQWWQHFPYPRRRIWMG
jgi:hypothetical protein